MPTPLTLVKDASNGLYDFIQLRSTTVHEHYYSSSRLGWVLHEIRDIVLETYAIDTHVSSFDIAAILAVSLHYANTN